MARSLEDPWRQATTLSQVAQVLAESGQRQAAAQVAADALQAAQAVPLERHLKWTRPGFTATMSLSDPAHGFALPRVDAVSEAAVALTLTGEVGDARAALERIRAGRHDVAELIQWRQAQALGALAIALAKSEQPKPAVELADLAQQLAAKLKAGRGRRREERDLVILCRTSAMAAAAQAYAATGEAELAEEAARRALQELEEVAGLSVEVECGPNTTMRAVLERRIPGIAGDLGWERVGQEIVLSPSLSGFHVTWTGNLSLPAEFKPGSHRIVVTEVETYPRDYPIPGDPPWSTSPVDFARARGVCRYL
ncbi:MAG: hypothetical protein M8467_14880 [Anaerolineae bacterium]|nr:hypothetical protein [Anaerolineae bacterium]